MAEGWQAFQLSHPVSVDALITSLVLLKILILTDYN
jgi:hypothetical protein